MVVILLVGGEPCAPSPTSSTTVSIISSGSQVSPEDGLAVTKQEEWVKRKKVEVVTKRQIATRVQREVVLEDGKVVQDSGPKVTTTTTEDTEQRESDNTEHHDMDDDKEKAKVEDKMVIHGEPGVMKEVREKKVTTRQVRNETTETEDVRHLGDISDEAYRRAVEGGGNLERHLGRLEVVATGPRVVGHSTRTTTTTDSEDTTKKTRLDASGQVVTDTSVTRHHEEVKEEEVPREGAEGEELVSEKKEHYSKLRDEEFVDYLSGGVKVATEMRYQAETTEGGKEWDWGRPRGRLDEPDRKDALTRRPLDPDQEERTRKQETSKWLEHHFGSESRSSDEEPPAGFINVTMRSAPRKPYFQGVTDWAESRRVQVLPTGPQHTFNRPSPPPVSPPPRTRHLNHQVVREEPSPDYSPEPRHRASPGPRETPAPADHKKKVYQRTRFAVDMPPAAGKEPRPKAKRSLGESFRRLVGKLGGAKGKRGGTPAGEVVDSGTQTGQLQTRYYLGEDPFQGSIYGRESEYTRESSTLGRLSKSTGRLAEREQEPPPSTTTQTDRGGVQTLPRRLEHFKQKKPLHVSRSNGYQGRSSPQNERYKKLASNSNSMFNVSIVNNVSPTGYMNGPVKPARTYQSNLLRSKSFNVHGGSSPQLHRLDGAHAPLKSPAIVSRSSRDLSSLDLDRKPLSSYNKYPRNGYNPRSSVDTKKKIFMKGLMERAPELYRTLNENERNEKERYNGKEYSSSYRSSNTSSPLDRVHSPSYLTNGVSDLNRSMVRRGSNDFTETYSYKTKNDDPLNPSETDTVKSFTKRIVPTPNGRRETIETRTVTKSKFRSATPDLKYLENGGKYSTNGGVVIEVRNTRK